MQTKSTLAEPKLRFDTNEFYLKSPEEMAESFAAWPEAVPTTLEIAERCNVEMTLGELLLPRYPTEDGSEPQRHAAPHRDRGPARAATATRCRPTRSSVSSTSSASSSRWASSPTS